MPSRLPHEEVTSKLRGSGVAGIAWGQDASPWYKGATEGTEPPFVEFDVGPSNVQHNFEDAYGEKYEVTVRVVALQENDCVALSSPYADGSVVRFLDSFRNEPKLMSGTNFECNKFERISYELALDETRAPGGGRVWVGEAKYNYWVSGV